MRSGDLFLEVSSSTQAKSLANLKKLAHLDVHVVAHGSLNSSRGVISPADFLNVSTEEILENMRDQRYVQSGVLLYLENTFRIRYVASIANDTVIQRTFVGASQPALVAEKWVTTVMNAAKRTLQARRVVSSRTPVPGVSYANVAKKKPKQTLPKLVPSISKNWRKRTHLHLQRTLHHLQRSPLHQRLLPLHLQRKKIISRPPSASPKRPKSRKARQREMSLSQHPRKMSNFSKKSHLMDEDMLELHPDDDEDLMDMMPGSLKPSSERGARATQ
ncbi:hypothetical protein TNCV_2824611 [Trichonephila clavipes]|nr:hypothetical protein TNCV_2824611 [Trichonephila clavipes]